MGSLPRNYLHFNIALYIAFCFTSLTVLSVQICFENEKIIDGQRLEMHIFSSKRNVLLGQCAKECVVKTKCHSFNYIVVQRLCEFNSVRLDETAANLTATHGHVFSEKLSWPDSIAGNCAGVLCSENDMCVVMADGQTACVISECGEPPLVDNGFVASPSRWMSCTVQYACQEGYTLIGDPNIECMVDGTWNSSNVQCIGCDEPQFGPRFSVESGCRSMNCIRNISCLTGYIQTGSGVAICGVDGSWVKSLTCEITTRLVGGPSLIEGRLEILYDGVYGTVCDDEWDNNDAVVACRQLGFFPYNATSSGVATYGRGTGPIILDDVDCVGAEDDIVECSHQLWGQHDCDHRQDAGIKCPSVRLVDGSTKNIGRVEVFYNGNWGTVCDDSWTNLSIAVVCNELGLPFSTSASLVYDVDIGTGDIWIDDMECTGNETTLLGCPFPGWGLHDCDHSEDVRIICQ